MPELVAIAYKDETAADRAVEEIHRCWEELLTDPDAASVLVCERDGGCRLTTSSHADATAHWSKFWGALLETLLSSEGPAAIDVTFRNRLRSLLRPGTSMLLLAAPRAPRQRILDALSHFEGEALSCRLADYLDGSMPDTPPIDEGRSACCGPSRGHGTDARGRPPTATRGPEPGDGRGDPVGPMIDLPGGAFTMGNDAGYGYPGDGEGPAHEVVLPPFSITAHAVTNARFARFVELTGHRTEAEEFGWSFVFGALLPADFPPTRAVAAAPWWRQVEGADWAHPEGPRSSWRDRPQHPVVHVSWNDAVAFCEWAGGRLPTEAEWEYAARGGLNGVPFPWGEELEPGGEHRMNVFQGTFPARDEGADGYVGTAPVGSFPPNGFGLFEMTGNVWEWTADRFDPTYYGRSPRNDPQGPERGELRVQRGGSYLCHASYCNRYRVDSRSSNSPDSSTGNLGFRVVRRAP